MNFIVADCIPEFNQVGVFVEIEHYPPPNICFITQEYYNGVYLSLQLDIPMPEMVSESKQVPISCDISIEIKSNQTLEVIMRQSNVKLIIVRREKSIEYLKMLIKHIVPIEIEVNTIKVPFLLANKIHWIPNIKKVYSIKHVNRELYFSRFPKNIDTTKHVQTIHWQMYTRTIFKISKYNDFKLIQELCKESGDVSLWYRFQNETGRLQLQLELFMFNFSDLSK